MTLQQFRDILLIVTTAVYHNKANKDAGNYIVWHEIGGGSLEGDNAAAESFGRIAVDYFTKQEYDTTPALIETTLEQADVAVSDVVIDFEDETGITHYSWTCEV